MGVKSKAEFRKYLAPAETLEESEKAIQEIATTDQSGEAVFSEKQIEFDNSSTAESVEETIEDTVSKSLNGAQTQSLINIVLQYQSGTLTKQQAINIISVSIGLSKEEAETLIAEV